MTYLTAHAWIAIWTAFVSFLAFPVSRPAAALCAAIGLLAMLCLRKDTKL